MNEIVTEVHAEEVFDLIKNTSRIDAMSQKYERCTGIVGVVIWEIM